MHIETLIPGTIVTRCRFATREEAASFADRLVPDDGTEFVVDLIPGGKSFGIRLVGDEWGENEWF